MNITNSGATTITDFDDGVDGQVLYLSFSDANTTLTDGGNLLLSGDYTSAANSTLTLLRVATGWREESRSFQVDNLTYTPTNVSTDRAYDADTVAVAELADVVGTLIADLQSKGILQ
jgi:hypothetical protein